MRDYAELRVADLTPGLYLDLLDWESTPGEDSLFMPERVRAYCEDHYAEIKTVNHTVAETTLTFVNVPGAYSFRTKDTIKVFRP